MANKRKHVAYANTNLNSNRRRAAYAVNEVNSALFWNARTGDEEAMRLLLANGATMAVTDESGCPVLIIAAMHGNEGAMCLLLEKGAAVDATDKYGQIALMKAASCRGCEEMVRLLLEKGAAVDATTKEGARLHS